MAKVWLQLPVLALQEAMEVALTARGLEVVPHPFQAQVALVAADGRVPRPPAPPRPSPPEGQGRGPPGPKAGVPGLPLPRPRPGGGGSKAWAFRGPPVPAL
jgi:hypothetical protein